jgi:acyl-CoA-binding protein
LATASTAILVLAAAQPNASDVRSYGKWMAWAGLKGMSQEEAQTKYADKIQELQRRKHATTKL